ncbi:MAG: hypothetical protein M0019_03205 [Actinomycetota bacterium]|nr:hypothetical protein [Actinomycetota bacterium]
MANINSDRTLIVIDFASNIALRGKVTNEESNASIYQITPYLLRSLSFRLGLESLEEFEEEDSGLHTIGKKAVSYPHMNQKSAIPSKSSGYFTEILRFADKTSKAGKAATDDELE